MNKNGWLKKSRLTKCFSLDSFDTALDTNLAMINIEIESPESWTSFFQNSYIGKLVNGNLGRLEYKMDFISEYDQKSKHSAKAEAFQC